MPFSGISGKVTGKPGRPDIPCGCISQETCRFAGTEPEGSDHEGLIVLSAGSPAPEGSVCDAFFPSGEEAFFIAIHTPLFIGKDV